MTRSLFQTSQIGWSSLCQDCRSLMKRILLLVPSTSLPDGLPVLGSYSILSTRLQVRIFSCTKSGDSFGYIPIGPLSLNNSSCSECYTILSARLYVRIFSFTKSGDFLGFIPINLNVEVTLTDHGSLEGFIEIMVFIPSHLFSSAQFLKITSRMNKAEP
jgi:hypothetical protein